MKNLKFNKDNILKKIFLSFLIFFLSLSLNSNNIPEESIIYKYNTIGKKIAYDQITEKEINGKVLVKHPNGKAKEICNYVKGIKDGVCEYFNTSGLLINSNTFKNGFKWSGTFNFKDTDYFLHKNGKLKLDVTAEYYDGNLNGKYIAQNEEGKLHSKGKYKSNLKDGYWEYKLLDKDRKGRGNFKDNIKIGLWKEACSWAPYCEGEYNSKGLREGKWKYIEESRYSCGKRIETISFKNDMQHGPWELFLDGRLRQSYNYKDGKMHGIQKWYGGSCEADSSFYLSSEYNKKNGKYHGKYISYHRNGQVVKELDYFEDKVIDGVYSYFHQNGNIQIEAVYENNREKRIKVFYFNGSLAMECKSFKFIKIEHKDLHVCKEQIGYDINKNILYTKNNDLENLKCTHKYYDASGATEGVYQGVLKLNKHYPGAYEENMALRCEGTGMVRTWGILGQLLREYHEIDGVRVNNN